MTLAELRTEVFRRLEESASSPVFWTAADITAALNEGYQEISDESEWDERVLTIDLLRERPYYDVRTVFPSSMLAIGAAYNDQTSRWLFPASPGDLAKGRLRWETVTGEPSHLLVRGLFWLGYWPQVAADSGTVQQHYVALPDDLVDDDDTPGFPETVHYGLVEYALAELWSQDAETTKAVQAWQMYLLYERALTDWVQGRIAVPLVHGHQTTATTPTSSG